jgi:hypothetical protein
METDEHTQNSCAGERGPGRALPPVWCEPGGTEEEGEGDEVGDKLMSAVSEVAQAWMFGTRRQQHGIRHDQVQ